MMRNAMLAFGTAVVAAACLLVALAIWHPAALAAWRQNHADQARALALGFPDTNFNWNTAYAEDRGCNACHGDQLAATVSQLVVPRGPPAPELHGIFATSYGIPMRVEDCLICHGNEFAGNIHSRHLHDASFTKMGGNCDSCHAMSNGKFVLYDDETRYNVLNGIKTIPTPAFSR